MGPDFAREVERQLAWGLGCGAALLVGFGVALGGGLTALIWALNR